MRESDWISSHSGKEVPIFPTTIPAQIFAKIHDLTMSIFFDNPYASAESTVSPAPVTSYTFLAKVVDGRQNFPDFQTGPSLVYLM